ncbi:PREDICTED: gametocyte-specific factor 1 homolog [Drosophila arizonae]|uniref:Gametocyte-specific factor 1 homolog n=1 Tax=Drosophila arizonae TaxID=7263 RepID=A0ABM1PM60_DROAR|nr:PREDICTED: gametocyte-specific factor 1 homolog [Drosophila arizonae]
MSSSKKTSKSTAKPAAKSNIQPKIEPNIDEYIKCPYDESHSLLPGRFAWHLTRCARNNFSSGMVRCPFNNTHVVKPKVLNNHLLNCPNRCDLERFLHPDALPPKEPRPSQVDLVECSENWDDEPPAPTYNPREYSENNLIIRQLVGATPAQRRQFREMERRRFERLNQNRQ